MDDVASAQNENENLRKIRVRLLQWEAKTDALAALNTLQEDCLEVLTNACLDEAEPTTESSTNDNAGQIEVTSTADEVVNSQVHSASFCEMLQLKNSGIDNTNEFLEWYDRVSGEIHQHNDAAHHRYLKQLELRSVECGRMLDQIEIAMQRLSTLGEEYALVSQKTSALNTASQKLIEEQQKLQQCGDEIQRRLHFFNQVELLTQRLQSPTISVASEVFRECLNRIDECLEYLRDHPNFKDSAAFTIRYRHCLAKATVLIKSYAEKIITEATYATLHPKQLMVGDAATSSTSSPDATFALYYGKYQTAAAKIKRVSQLVEARLQYSVEYEQLLADMQQNYLTERAGIMSPAVDKAIKELRTTHKSDQCALMRSTCAFLVHVCQDEQRLFFQFFGRGSEQLTVYLEGLCVILYDTMRPFIIHINHLETLAEICCILRIEMLEEHVQQNPEALKAFASTANQLLQDVQERLVFRAHLYMQSDILNYNPSAGDIAYPQKLQIMESIALSLQDNHSHMRRSDSRSSLVSVGSCINEGESIDTPFIARNMNSPADLHGMWYPTVRRTLVCLSRLYRCVDRPIFQGLSQEALKLCIQSVSSAAIKISAAQTPIDGELFEIKHLLILREQIAPFRVDFTVKETSLDFSKVKTAAFGLLQKRKQLFSMGSNNALLEFLLEGTPLIKEHLLDSRKEVDRQLKTVCEQFIKDAVQMLIGPMLTFMTRAQTLLASEAKSTGEKDKTNYVLRQSSWASPQQISGVIQETQRLIKGKLAQLQRSMQLYLSNRDTEFIIFRPIRNNVIQSFVKLEQLLSTNGYTSDDLIITSCPSAEQVSVLISSASILAAENIVNFSSKARTLSTSSSNDGASVPAAPRRLSVEKKVAFENAPSTAMENVPEMSESGRTSPAPVDGQGDSNTIEKCQNALDTV